MSYAPAMMIILHIPEDAVKKTITTSIETLTNEAVIFILDSIFEVEWTPRTLRRNSTGSQRSDICSLQSSTSFLGRT